MLEKIFNKEDFPISAKLLTIEDYPLHYHSCIQILYVMSGNIELKVSFSNYILNEGDIHIINIRDVYAIKGILGENVVLSFYLDTSYFARNFADIEEKIFISYQNKRKNHNENYYKLIELMKEAVKEFNSHDNINKDKDKDKAVSIGKNCIEILYEDFQYFSVSRDEKQFKMKIHNQMDKANFERINGIVEEIYQNYSNRISLVELSKKVHINKYYLSHLIKANTGENFQNFVSMVRTEMSELLLLETNKSITEIALECGFSNSQYYKSHFIKWFSASPVSYRKEYKDKVLGKIAPSLKEVSAEFIGESDCKNRIIAIDMQENSKSQPLFLKACIFKLVEAEMLQTKYLGSDILEMLTQEMISFGEDYIVTKVGSIINVLIFQYNNSMPKVVKVHINNLLSMSEIVVRENTIIDKKLCSANYFLLSSPLGFLEHQVSLYPDSINMISFLVVNEKY